jgi:hypothetical protein
MFGDPVEVGRQKKGNVTTACTPPSANIESDYDK